MKAVLAVLAVLVFIVSFQSQAKTPQRYTEVSLDVMSISKTSPLAEEQLEGGLLSIDHYQDTAKLILYRKASECPKDLYCTLVMPAPIIIEFENLEVEEGACGSFIFSAVIDDSDVDGLIETLEVVDNTWNRCMHLNIVDQFEVTYATYAPRSRVMSEAKFKGPREEKVTLPVQPLAAM